MIRNLCRENIKLTYFEAAILFCSNVPQSLLLSCYFLCQSIFYSPLPIKGYAVQGVKYYRLSVGCY